MQLIVKEVEDLRRFLYRTEYFIRNDSENLHADTLKYYLATLYKQLENIKSGKLAENDELLSFQSRLSSCEQYLNSKIEHMSVCPSKISRTADLESRQLLLRGSAQRESRQREELLKSKKQKNEEQHLTLRQRRLLLLENDDDRLSDVKTEAENEKEAQSLASQTLQLTRVLREQAVNTKSIVGEDNKLLGDMDTSMENNLGNLKNATMSVEDILKSSGSSQYLILFLVFMIWIFMIVIITTVPKLN